MTRLYKKESGFTLIELMIAILISIVVLAGVMEIFSTNYRSYILQDDVGAMQENLRIGMMFLQRDMQMIGSGMIGADVVDPSGALTSTGFQGFIKKNSATEYELTTERAYPIEFKTDIKDTKPGSGVMRIRYIKTPDSADLINSDADNTCGSDDTACDKLPMLVGTLTTSTQFTLTPPSDPSLTAFTIGAWQSGGLSSCSCKGLSPKNYVVISGFTATSQWGSDIVPVTSVDPANTVTLSASPKNTYPQEVSLSFLNPRTAVTVDYVIKRGDDPDDKGYYLKRDINDLAGAQPVAENIEDLQFAVEDNNGNVTCVTNNMSNTDILNIRMIRVTLLARTRRPNNTFKTGIRTAIQQARITGNSCISDDRINYLESKDNLAPDPPDGQDGRFYVWKLIQSTIKVRNMGTP